MISKINKFILLLLSVAGILSPGTVRSQPLSSDSLSLITIIREVIQTHPMVKKATEELTTSDARIGFAQSASLPTVDFASSYSRIGPISQITLPDVGTFSLMPHDNYAASFNLNQTISDFGKTDKNVQLEKQGKELNITSVEQVKQKLSQVVTGNYYSLVYLQEAVKIKDEQLGLLNEHLRYIQKKLETGSATQYEILTTQVRISVIENQKTDIETALKLQICQLNTLLGKPVNTPHKVKNDLNREQQQPVCDSLIAVALTCRDEMKLARGKAKLAEIRLSLTNSQNNPVFNAFFSGGIKNGYIPYMYDPKANYVAGVGIKVPVFDGKRNKYNLVLARSAMDINDHETEITRRTIINEVVESLSNLDASQKKIYQSELQLSQATQAYELAKVRFSSGVITNLELLEGSTAISESRLMLLKARIEYSVNIFKVKSAIGERLY